MKTVTGIGYLILALGLLLTSRENCVIASGLSISEDGGYNLVVAIEKGTPEPSDAEAYIGNIKVSLHAFSLALWRATEKFYIKSADILIPNTWSIANDAIDIGHNESYLTASIRLSETFKYPSDNNPNPCGLPGQHISLPVSYFNNVNAGDYGQSWKALLPLWARYRYGVWEEHGFPNHEKYPYFSKYAADSPTWTVTGCSNEDLRGQYRTSNGDQCDMISEPSDSCRFYPNPLNNATTSLMHFHWLESVTKFCDESTHNQFAPNRQNLLCNQSSIMEVIEASADNKAVTTDPLDHLHVPQFRTIKSTKPFFYFLVDKGRPEVELPLLIRVVLGFIDFFQPDVLPNAVTAFGTYPATQSENGASVNNEIEFESLEMIQELILVKLADFTTDGDLDRDFATPFLDIVNLLKAKSPYGGGVIFVLKTGPSVLGDMPFEDQVLATLRQEQIKVIALELGTQHLKSFTEQTGGNSQLITEVSQIDPVLNELLTQLQIELDQQVEVPTSNLERLLQGTIGGGFEIPIPIRAEMTSWEFYVVLNESVTSTISIFVDGGPVPSTNKLNWGESGTPNSEIVYYGQVENIKEGNSEWTFSYSCSNPDCPGQTALVFFYGATNFTESPATDAVDIVLSTTALDNVVDFNVTVSVLAPFAIFAKITKGGTPVTGLVVTAFITKTEPEEVIELVLNDNGNGVPDIAELDGVFSGNFIPESDGIYRISVEIDATSTSRIKNQIRPENFIGSSRLLPVDQNDIRPEEPIELDEDFLMTVNHLDITVKNRASLAAEFLDRPLKIREMKAVLIDDAISVTFQKPTTFSGTGNHTYLYEVYASRTIRALGNGNPAVIGNGTSDPQDPSFITITFPMRPNYKYVGLKTRNGDIISELSVIMQVTEEEVEVTEPPTTEDTTTSDDGDSSGTDDPASTTTTTTVRPTDPEDDDKPFFQKAGGIVVIILIVLIAAGAIGGGAYFYLKKKRSAAKFEKLDSP